MFVSAASRICKVVLIQISTGTPIEENHDTFSIFLFHRYWRFTGQQGKTGNRLSSLYHFHEHSDIYLQFCIMFNKYKHSCVLGKQKYTTAVWYNVYITKSLLSVLTEARSEVPKKHCSPNPCFFSFLIFSLKSNPSRNIVVRYNILI